MLLQRGCKILALLTNELQCNSKEVERNEIGEMYESPKPDIKT